MNAVVRPTSVAPIFGNGFATFSVAFGILGVGVAGVSSFDTYAMVFGAISLLCGLVGIFRAYRSYSGHVGIAILGTSIGALAVLFAVINLLSHSPLS